MKKNSFISIFMVMLAVCYVFISCSKDDDEGSSGFTVTLTTADYKPYTLYTDSNSIEYGYFDGVMYYQITSKEDKTIAVTRCEKEATSADIPENVVIDGIRYLVTSIGSDTFSGCRSLTSVTISNSVTSIDDYAFYGCVNLTTVTIGNSVTSIGRSAFRWCQSLTSVIIPNSVTTIGDIAFSGCNSLTSLTLPNSVTYIGDDPFNMCNNLKMIEIKAVNPPKLDYSLGANALIYVPTNSVEDYKRAWTECQDRIRDVASLKRENTSVEVHEEEEDEGSIPSLTAIDYTTDGYFDGVLYYQITSNSDKTAEITKCSPNASAVEIPRHVKLNETTFSITGIRSRAFMSCEKLSSVIISNSVVYIGEQAFVFCGNLSSVVFGKNVTRIGPSAFAKTMITRAEFTSVESFLGIQYENKVSHPFYRSSQHHSTSLYINGEEINDLSIPDNISTIPRYAFWGCTNLRFVTIPNSVTSIGGSPFYGCNGLNGIKIESANPPTIEGGLGGTFAIYVPQKSVDIYKTAEGWKQYADKIQGY